MPYRRTPLVLVATATCCLTFALTACGSGLPTGAVNLPTQAQPTNDQATGNPNVDTSDPAQQDTGTTTQAAGIDPCKKLTTADVQPFVTVGLHQGLPISFSSGDQLGCEWKVGLGTSVDVLVITGQDGQDKWDIGQSQGGGEQLSGIGDKAEHLSGDTDMWAIKGIGSSAIWCGVTTVGWQQLAGKKDLSDVVNIPDDKASAIAEQYGTLCNKIYGSGTTTPTMTVPAPASTSADGPGGTALAAGGVMAGTDIPIPAGTDCSSAKQVRIDSEHVDCDSTTTDAQGAYDFFLQALPAAGYQINSKNYETDASGQPIGLIGFSSGKDFPGFDSINIRGTTLSISLSAQ